jgi:hypothetical protein
MKINSKQADDTIDMAAAGPVIDNLEPPRAAAVAPATTPVSIPTCHHTSARV